MKKFYMLLLALLCTIGVASASNWYLVGANYGWSDNATYKFSPAGGDEYTLTVAELAGKIKVKEEGTWSTSFGSTGGVLKENVVYNAAKDGGDINVDGVIKDATITINTADYTILVKGKAAENEYSCVYLIGDFGNGWSESDTSMPLNLKAGSNNVYTGKYTFEASINYFKMKAGNYVYGTGGSDINVVLDTEYTASMSGNAFSLGAGEFTFSYVLDKNAETGLLTVTGEGGVIITDLYLTGSFYLNSEGGWATSEDNMFKYADGLYTMTDYEITETGIFQVSSADWKVQYGGKDVVIDLDHLTATLSGGGYDDNATINCTGKFDITFNATTREIKFVAKGGNQQGSNEPAELYLMGEKWGYDANCPKFDCTDGIYTIKGIEVTPGSFTIQSADYKVGFGNSALTISSTNLSGVLTEGAYDNNVTLDLTGKCDIEFVLATKTVTFTVVGQVTPPAATVPATLYICGDLKGRSWVTDDMLGMVKAGNVFTAENVEFEAAGENTLCWFNLCTSMGATWDDVNSADRYGAAKEDTAVVLGADNAVTKYTVGIDASNCKSWTVEPGKYNLTVDFTDAASPVMVITKVPTSGVASIDAEAGEAIYFNFQGQRVANPEKGMYIRVVNGKASKVAL